MSDSVVIVGIPREDDKVYRISSEKVPHLTLVSLDYQFSSEQLIKIVEFTQHAASQLSPFGLTVDYRGILGENAADVLFFEKEGWSFPRISSFRAHLLQEDSIRLAYENSEQFPEWNPHLTLGFPETPAKPDESEYPGINYVSFDRIAVWMGDYEGPTFRLKYEEDSMEVAMSDTASETAQGGMAAVRELFHYGKKGMKWGVRNDKGHEGEKAKTKKIDKLDNKFEKHANRLGTFLDVHNAAADLTNKNDISRINNKPEYKDANFSKPSELRTKYYQEHQDAFVANLEKAATAKGTNASGTKKYSVHVDDDGNWSVYTAEVKHAGSSNDINGIQVTVVYKDGWITGVSVPEQEVQHFENEGAFLTHYGKKGMKWGVTTVDKATSPTLTREKRARRNEKDVTVTQRKAGTFVKTKGGQRQKASDDAVKAHAGRQKAKKSTTDALTNDELKATIERMRLEQDFAKLDSKVKRRGQGFIAQFFSSPEARKTGADLAKRIAATP